MDSKRAHSPHQHPYAACVNVHGHMDAAAGSSPAAACSTILSPGPAGLPRPPPPRRHHHRGGLACLDHPLVIDQHPAHHIHMEGQRQYSAIAKGRRGRHASGPGRMPQPTTGCRVRVDVLCEGNPRTTCANSTLPPPIFPAPEGAYTMGAGHRADAGCEARLTNRQAQAAVEANGTCSSHSPAHRLR
jgi:hypothetical protein